MTDSQPDRKSWTERWYRAMLLGYPAQYRERHGAELVGTLLEAHPSRRRPSLRESAHLLDAGLLARLRTRLDTLPAWAAGVQLGVLLLALTQAGMQLGRVSTHQQAGLAVLLPSLLDVVPLLLGRMGVAAVLAAIPAVAVTVQGLAVWAPAHGTDTMVGFFVSRTFQVSSGTGFWLTPELWQFWAIAAGSAVLALSGRTRGPLPRRSWGWLAVPVVQAAFTACNLALAPAVDPLTHRSPAVPASFTALQVVPVIVTVGLLLLALRATAVLGDARWTIAAGVYLIPTGVLAAALAALHPSAVATLDQAVPTVLLAAACAAVLLRGAPRRAEG